MLQAELRNTPEQIMLSTGLEPTILYSSMQGLINYYLDIRLKTQYVLTDFFDLFGNS